MPLARSLSVTSLNGLDDWDDDLDLENSVLFEVAWEVANKGEWACALPAVLGSSLALCHLIVLTVITGFVVFVPPSY